LTIPFAFKVVVETLPICGIKFDDEDDEVDEVDGG